MAVETGASPTPAKRKHKLQIAPIAREITEYNEHGWFQAHESAIDAMEALHELDLSADATPLQRQQKRDAFMAMSAVARLAAPMETMNTSYLLSKEDSDDVRDAVVEVKKAQKAHSERRKVGTK